MEEVEEKDVEKVKLQCGVYGEGSVFSVEVECDADVEALQEAIVNKKKDVNARFNVDPATVTLYLARMKQGDNDEWLKSDATFEGFLKRGRQEDEEYPYVKMIPNWILGEDYLGANFQPGRKEIHVLVELPKREYAHPQFSSFRNHSCTTCCWMLQLRRPREAIISRRICAPDTIATWGVACCAA